MKNLDDPVFGGGLPEVDGDLSYRVEYAGEVTRDFTVKVFEHPRLDRADALAAFLLAVQTACMSLDGMVLPGDPLESYALQSDVIDAGLLAHAGPHFTDAAVRG